MRSMRICPVPQTLLILAPVRPVFTIFQNAVLFKMSNVLRFRRLRAALAGDWSEDRYE